MVKRGSFGSGPTYLVAPEVAHGFLDPYSSRVTQATRICDFVIIICIYCDFCWFVLYTHPGWWDPSAVEGINKAMKNCEDPGPGWKRFSAHIIREKGKSTLTSKQFIFVILLCVQD